MKKIFSFLAAVLMAGSMMAQFDTWSVVGNKAIMNGTADWAIAETANDMTTEDGVNYTLTVTGKTLEVGKSYEYKIAKGHAWSNGEFPSQNAKLTVTETAVYDIVYTADVNAKTHSAVATKTGTAGEITHTYSIAGDNAGLFGAAWSATNTATDMTKGEDDIYRWTAENVELAAGTILYKVVVDHAWGEAYPAQNASLVIAEDAAYDVVFTFNPANKAVDATATKAGVEPGPGPEPTAGNLSDTLTFYTTEGFDNIDIVTPGQSNTGGDYEFTKGGTTVTGTNGYIYNKKHTVYKSGKMVITAPAEIDSVIITYNSNCYPFAEALAGGSTTTKTSGITTTTFIPESETSVLTFTNASAGKTELRELIIFYAKGAGPEPETTVYYIKHNWGGAGDWTWKEMTYDAEAENYTLREIYGATGCNWNTSASDEGSSWVASPTVVGNPAVGDSAVFALKNGEITITKIGEPAPEPTTRFLKHNWGGAGDWTWKEMTREGETDTYTLRDIYGGTGCNWNTVGNDAGATWVAEPILEGEPAEGDSAVFALVEGVITITKIEGEGPGPEPTYNYYLVGTLAEGGWDADNAMPMEGDSIVRSVAAGTYEFKVLTTLGSWDNALGYSNVNAECSSEGYEQSGTNNVKVTLIADGDVKVKVVDGQICVVGSFGEAVVTSYTIAGDAALMGVNWAPAAEANDMEENDGTWTLVKTDVELTAKSYEYKVVGNHTWGVADFPASGNNTLTIEEDATYDVTFTWIPAENSLTANAVKKGSTTGLWNTISEQVQKTVINGQVVIIKNGVKYNVMGKSL